MNYNKLFNELQVKLAQEIYNKYDKVINKVAKLHKTSKQAILDKISKVILEYNVVDGVMSINTSGVALSSRLISLRNKVIVVQKCLENCIKQRIRHLFRYLDVYKGIVLDHRDINVQFTMNLPQDDLSMAQIISQLSDKLSIQTGLSQLSFITDANKEFEKMLEEQRIIEQNSLETLDNIDTDTQDEAGAADELQ